MKHTKRDELTLGERVVAVLGTVVVAGPPLVAWMLYGKDIMRWYVNNLDTILWATIALTVAVAVVFVWRAVRKSKPKRYGIIPAETIRAIMK